MKPRPLFLSVFLFCIVSAGRLIAAETSTPVRFFVSLQGNDTGSGTLESPSDNGADGPLRSLEAARDRVRTLPFEKRRRQPIEICLLPGTITVDLSGLDRERIQ